MNEYLFPEMNREDLPTKLETLGLNLVAKLGTEEFSRDDLMTFAKELHAVSAEAVATEEDRESIRDLVQEIFSAAKEDMGKISDKDLDEASELAKNFFMAVSSGISTTQSARLSPEMHKSPIKALATLSSFMPASDVGLMSTAISTLLPPRMKALISDAGILTDDIYATIRKEFEMATNSPEQLAENRALAAQYIAKEDLAGELLKVRNQVTPQAIKKLVASLADKLDPEAVVDMVINALETTAHIAKSIIDTGGSPKLEHTQRATAAKAAAQIKDFLTVLENAAAATGIDINRDKIVTILNGYITRTRGEYQETTVAQDTPKPPKM